MDIATYLRENRGAGVRLAVALGVAPAQVSQWCTGVRPVPLWRCTQIEAATNGSVRRWDLRPDDWWRQWPELVGAPGAPPWPADARTEAATEAAA